MHGLVLAEHFVTSISVGDHSRAASQGATSGVVPIVAENYHSGQTTL